MAAPALPALHCQPRPHPFERTNVIRPLFETFSSRERPLNLFGQGAFSLQNYPKVKYLQLGYYMKAGCKRLTIKSLKKFFQS